MGALQAHADRIIWCYVAEETDQVKVTLAGWSTPKEVAMKAITWTGPAGRQLENHQIGLTEMHTFERFSSR